MSKSTCGFCFRAKALLDAKHVDYEEYELTWGSPRREEMIQRSNGRTTVPQIFIDGKHVGGCDDLFALERDGKLDQYSGGLMVRIALFQSNSGIDPAANGARLVDAIGRAADDGAAMIFTPEMSGLLDRDSARAASNVRVEDEDEVLAACRNAAHAQRNVGPFGLARDPDRGRPARQSRLRHRSARRGAGALRQDPSVRRRFADRRKLAREQRLQAR